MVNYYDQSCDTRFTIARKKFFSIFINLCQYLLHLKINIFVRNSNFSFFYHKYVLRILKSYIFDTENDNMMIIKITFLLEIYDIVHCTF